MSYQLRKALPWWFKKFILRKKNVTCDSLYIFEEEEWNESDMDDHKKGSHEAGEGVSSGVDVGTKEHV